MEAGKSLFLVFILIQRLQKSLVTLFMSSSRELYLFLPNGTYTTSTVETFKFWHLQQFPNLLQSRIWSLIDADDNNQEPPAGLVVRSHFYAVHAVSPNPQRFKNWKKQQIARIIVMEPWSDAELEQGLELLNPAPQKINVPQLREQYGPCIRDIISALEDDGQDLKNDINQALKELPNNINIVASAAVAGGTDAMHLVSHRLFVVGRIRSREDHHSDRLFVEAKSLSILRDLSNRCREIHLQDAQDLYSLCSPFPESSPFGGWVFEKLAVYYTSGAPPIGVASERVVTTLSGMSSADPPEGLRFVYDPPGATEQLDVACWSVKLLPVSEHITHGSTRHAIDSLPILCNNSSRQIRYVSKLENVTADPHLYYVFTDKRHPLFDAFFYEYTGSQGYVLWVLQMTTSARHGGSELGYDDVQYLRTIAGCCSVHYVLVVPDRNRRVVWTMPGSWSDWEPVQGLVCVQHLNLDILL
ncbi:hypothetical protein VKT23_015752 [Stygiomarasmius scandens]|uniref:Uncharacterized protein n=1 Tax=Marasmiellus scandens TaxID=2682957 RepID=A0ABR1IX51_9AGAR